MLEPESDYWFSAFSVVYDIKNLKDHLIMQEGMFDNSVIEFGIW